MLDLNSTSPDATLAQPVPVALFISDLHLHEGLPLTTQAFFTFLRDQALKAQQLYLLGDVFEYWAGDDDIVTGYNQQVAGAIRRVSDAGVSVFWMAGNRDFLVGKGFAQATGATILPDPSVTTIAGQRIVLTHGDAQCTDDTSYMAFRAQVRQPGWQQTFLEMPLQKRKEIINGMRHESRQAQRNKSSDIMDVNANAIAALFNANGADTIIHGHTHRPARHTYQENGSVRIRYVLPDWDCDDEEKRGGWIAICDDATIRRYAVHGAELP